MPPSTLTSCTLLLTKNLCISLEKVSASSSGPSVPVFYMVNTPLLEHIQYY